MTQLIENLAGDGVQDELLQEEENGWLGMFW